MMLSLKVILFITENISPTDTTEISNKIDFDDTENDEKSDTDEEFKEIHKTLNFVAISNSTTNAFNHFTISNLYRIQFSEFTTPPPKIVQFRATTKINLTQFLF